MPFNFEPLRHILACPKSRCDLVPDGESLVSTDPATRRRYPVLDDIPRLIAEESSVLAEDVWSRIMEQNQRDPQTGQPSSAPGSAGC